MARKPSSGRSPKDSAGMSCGFATTCRGLRAWRRSGGCVADCLFCRVVAGEIPAAIVYQDERIIAFKDINPQAPTHLLVIPRRHIARLNDLTPEDDALAGEMI